MLQNSEKILNDGDTTLCIDNDVADFFSSEIIN